MEALKAVNASMGLMLESTNANLSVHKFAPNKKPHLRVEQLRQAGKLGIPFTTGLLLGIGENQKDRIDSLQVIREIAEEFGHIQECILQPYMEGSKDKHATDRSNYNVDNSIDGGRFSLEDLPSFVKTARGILPNDVQIQIPLNLVRNDVDLLKRCFDAGKLESSIIEIVFIIFTILIVLA